ncbi:hypothetical protein D3C81_1872710 [compost metagenome]
MGAQPECALESAVSIQRRKPTEHAWLSVRTPARPERRPEPDGESRAWLIRGATQGRYGFRYRACRPDLRQSVRPGAEPVQHELSGGREQRQQPAEPGQHRAELGGAVGSAGVGSGKQRRQLSDPGRQRSGIWHHRCRQCIERRRE